MSRAAVLAGLLCIAIVLSGCASKEKDKESDTSSSSSSSGSRSSSSGPGSTTSSSTGSSTSGTQTGAPGAGTITVDFKRATPNGPVPLAVNFSLNASFSRDGAAQGAPAGLAWSVRIVNGTTLANLANATAGPNGATLPAAFQLNFTTAGDFLVLANVSATGYTPSSATIQVNAVAPGPNVPAFFDGAEGDTSQWTLASKALITNIPFAPVPAQEGGMHPAGTWAASTDEFRTGTKSWHSPYPDNIRATMTSVAIPLKAGPHTLTYALKGGAEGTSVEGVFVLIGPAGGALQEVAHHSGPDMAWTTFTVDVPAAAGASMQVQFRFDTDLSCSSEPAPVPPADPAGLCGAGYDAGGYYVDDITVA